MSDVTKRTRFIARVAFALALGMVGCGGSEEKPPPAEPAPGAAPDGIETSWNGYLSKTYDGDLGFLVEAIRRALGELHIDIGKESEGFRSVSFEAESQDGTSLVVDASEVTKELTRVSVKVGYFLGQRDAARRVHSEIEDEIAGFKKSGKRPTHGWGSFVTGRQRPEGAEE
jgi:hypothetical protein